MSKYLITGGAGFIGTNYVKYLLKHSPEAQILVLDKLTYAANLSNLQAEIDQMAIQFLRADIADEQAIQSAFQTFQPDYIIHFAAESHVDNSIKDPGIFVRTNVLGTQILLDQAKKLWQNGTDEQGYPTYRPGVKFLHISTDEVYGHLAPHDPAFTEDLPLHPRSPYSASKAASDLIVLSYHSTFHLPINITRCSNNYGPYQHSEKLIPLMISKALQNQKLPVYGKGEQIRDWLFVEDHCRGIQLVLEQGNLGEIYNIGGGQEMVNLDLVKTLLQQLAAKKPELTFIDENLISFVPDRLGHDFRYAINIQKIHTALGYQPQTDFPTGLAKTIDFYLQQPGSSN